MRLLVIGFAVAVVSLVAVRDAGATRCKEKGKVIYRETVWSLDDGVGTGRAGADDAPAPRTLEIRASGSIHWLGGDVDTGHRCLTRAQLAELKRAIGKAKFAIDKTSAYCAAVPTRRIRYEAPGRRKKVEVERECGPALEARTQALVACVEAVQRDVISDDELRAICRAEPPPTGCKADAAIVYRMSAWPITRGQAENVEESKDGWTSQLVIRKSGHVARLTADSATERCVDKAAMAELTRALKAAKFKLVTDAMTCKALPNEVVLYEALGRKKHVQTERPCGTPVDDGTANLAACAEAIADDTPAAERKAICRGE